MKQLLSRWYIASLLLIISAALLSVLTYSTQTIRNVPFCIHAAGCNAGMEPKGAITDRQYGFPVSYKRTSTFVPIHYSQNDPKYPGFAESTAEQQPLSVINIMINILFWSALLFGLWRLFAKKKQGVEHDSGE